MTLSAPSLFNGLGDSWSFELKVTDATGAFRTSACSVQVLDVTPPNVIVPGPLTEEAKGADGAPVSFSVSAMDDWSGDVSPSVVCTPASGSLFPLGTTTVTCKVKDAAGNEGSGSFDVTVRDTTPPAVTVPGNIAKVEATGPGGAPVSFTATASDLVDGPVAAACTPPSGSTFALGTTAVSCSATDAHGNTGSGSFTVEVVDTSPPVLTVPGNIAKLEATGPGGAAATFSGSASDVVDGPVAVTCNPASGSTFVLGTTTVSCSAKDAHGNEATGSFTVEVVDTTPPNLEPKDVTAEATGAAGAVVTYTVTATDLVDGPVAAACLPASGQAFPLGDTVVSCSATDAHTNRKDATFKVTVVDTTPPTVTVPANITTGPTKVGGGPATFSASAWDLVDGPVLASCDWLSNSLFPFGPTTVTCSASDAHGNVGHASFTVTVTPFTFDGFYQPVDNNGVVNAVKGGATVPIKFRLFGQGVEIKDTAAVDLSKLRAVRTNCSGSAEQTVDVTTTGGTSLRYDTTGSQFVLNWQTPKLPGTCLQLELGFVDGAAGGKVQTALFKLK